MSGWAWSSVDAIMSATFIETGTMSDLSIQQCIDCGAGEYGCSGAEAIECFEYLKTYALESSSDYPMTGWWDSCADRKDLGKVGIKTYNRLQSGSVEQMKASIAKGPTVVQIDGVDYPFTHYFGGIITDSTCGIMETHHALAVGYGVENGTNYFLLKNSWGVNWGENGYVRIAYDKDGPGICGVQVGPITFEIDMNPQ